MKAQSHAHAPSEAKPPKAVRSSHLPSPSAPHQGDHLATQSPQLSRGTVRVQDPPLVRVLLREAQRRGDQLQQMAERLGCTYGYISQLRNGIREPEHIGQEFAQKAAVYLGVPAALVKLLAGRLTIRDFAWPQRSREDDIADGLDALRDDPVIGAMVPEALYQAAPEVQEFVFALYTECAELHPHRVRALPRMLDYLQRAALLEADFEVKLARLHESLG